MAGGIGQERDDGKELTELMAQVSIQGSGWRTDPRKNARVRAALSPARFLLGRRLFRKCFGHLPVLGNVAVRLPDGKKFHVEAGLQDEIATELYFHGFSGFEAETTQLFWRLARRSSVVFDIGANIGVFGLTATAANGNAQVFAFEPVPAVFQALERNQKLNRFENLTPVCAALTDYDGEITLYVPPGQTPTSASTKERFAKRRKRSVAVQVRALQGDTFCKERGLTRLDLIKVDTEASEPDVLRGLAESLDRFSPVIVCEVLAERTEQALMAVLGPLRYKFWSITDQGLIAKEVIAGDRTYRFKNYLFSRQPIDL